MSDKRLNEEIKFTIDCLCDLSNEELTALRDSVLLDRAKKNAEVWVNEPNFKVELQESIDLAQRVAENIREKVNRFLEE